MAMVSEFVAAINQISSERGIDPEAVYEALESAVAAAFKREYNHEGDVSVEMDRETGTFMVIQKKVIVEKVENADLEISIKDAQEMQKGLQVGDTIEIEQQVEDFGRIAAQTAKQVIMQKIRESEKEAVLEEYSDKVGEIFTAMMHRMQGGEAVFEIGKAVAYMPPEEQVSNEFYRIGERYKVLLKEIGDGVKGKSLIVSRSSPEFLKGLFRMEVPEIESGVVEIKDCAREAGSRSKMSVTSHQDGVDPIGSCVGQRGMRIANVMSELGQEKIDIIEWREDPEDYVEKALSPAQVESVEIKGDTAIVKVAEDQLSLAIGKDGQNVRLAAKLTGFKIDIQGPNTQKADVVAEDEATVASEVEEVEATNGESASKNVEAPAVDSGSDDNSNGAEEVLGSAIMGKLEKAGKSLDEIADWEVEQLTEIDGIGKVSAQKIYDYLQSIK